MSAKADFALRLSMGLVGANAFSAGPYWGGDMSITKALASGVGVDQFDVGYMAERTVLTGADDDIDLAGVLTDPLGATVAIAKLVGLFIINRQKDGTANTTTLTIGGGSNPVLAFLQGTTPKLGPIGPGGTVFLFDSDAGGLGTVAAGTADILRITNSAGATNKYLIGLLGKSA